MSIVGIGLVGAGYWGKKLLRVFDAVAGAEVHVVAEVDAGRRGAVAGARDVTADARSLFRDDRVDAVVIATPPATHFVLARDALRAGRHCWVEKPLALSVEHAESLVQVAREHTRTLFVDETFLYDPLIQRARQWIRNGRFGQLFHLSFERLGLGRIRRDSDVWWNSAPHDLAILRFLVSEAVEEIEMRTFAHLHPDRADICVAALRLTGGISAQISVSWLSPAKVARVMVVGECGMLRYDGRFGARELAFYEYRLGETVHNANVVPVESFALVETVCGGAEEPLALAAQAFIESVRTGRPAPSDGKQAIEVVRLLAEGVKSRLAT